MSKPSQNHKIICMAYVFWYISNLAVKFEMDMFGFKEVDVLGLEQLQEGAKCLLIDVRTEAEVARGGIGGAIHIPLHLLPMKVQDLPKELVLVFYCQSGGRSAQACAFVASKGLDDVYNLQGGIVGWIRSGKPLAAI